MCFCLEIVITIFFWSFEYDAPSYNDPWHNIDLYGDHSLPLIMLTIDFCVNRVYYELHSLWINLIYVIVYGLINMAYTLITGTAVYPVITWDSIVACCVAFTMVPFFMLLWLGVYYLSQWKFKKLEMDMPCMQSQLLLGQSFEEKPDFKSATPDHIGNMNLTASSMTEFND